MRILVSIENKECLESLRANLCAFLTTIDDTEINIDIIHVYQPVKVNAALNLEDTLEQIKSDEHKTKVKFIAECENKIETYIHDDLNKAALVNSYLLEGEYKEQIKKHIIFHSYSLLVLVPRQKLNFNEILKGRHTHWVIDNLEVPILLLPSNIALPSNENLQLTCFVDEKQSYDNLMYSELVQKVKANNIQFLHFGRVDLCPEVKTIPSDNIKASLKAFTESKESSGIYVLIHKTKGDFLNFINKSFTKTLIGSLENPLLIF